MLVRRFAGLAGAGLLFAGCAGLPMPAVAQSGTNIPVLVMGEDADPNSVSRRSNIHKRVLAALKDTIQRDGFRMIDEEMIASDLGWRIRDRRPKTELIEAAKLANTSSRSSHRVRAMMTFTVFATRERTDFAQRIQTRIEGEIYDVPNNRFLGAFELPRAFYPAPADCNERCIVEVVGDKARDIALDLGAELRKKLALLSPDPGQRSEAPVRQTEPQSAAAPTAAPPPPAAHPQAIPARPRQHRAAAPAEGLVSSYTVTFRNFATVEVQEMTRVMREEFPGAQKLELMESGSTIRRYAYLSTADGAKLVEWFNIQLRDMGFDLDREVSFNVTGTEILVDKLVVRRRQTEGRPSPRFQ